MNMTPTTIQKPLSPFVAKIDFKRETPWRGQYHYTFFSDKMVHDKTSEAHKINVSATHHLNALERLIFQDLKDTYICVSIFDNRMASVDQDTKKRLIYQQYYSNVTVDKRSQLDLSFLYPKLDGNFRDFLIQSSLHDHNHEDFRTRLQLAIEQNQMNNYEALPT